jgi:membrane protein
VQANGAEVSVSAAVRWSCVMDTHGLRDDAADGTAFGKRLFRRMREDDVAGLSAEIAYRFLFAVFPFGLFVAAFGAFAATWLGIGNPAEALVDGLGDNLPPSLAQALQPELERLLDSARPGLLVVGASAALVAATGGTNALVKGIHRAHDIPERRPFLLRYAVAAGLTVVVAIGVIGAFVTIVGGAMLTEDLAGQLGVGAQAFVVMRVLAVPVVIVGLGAAVALVYRYGPTLVIPWRWIVVGAAVFTIGWVGATFGLAWYVGNIADYGATYGSLGAVIVLMLWFYLTAGLLLAGAEVTAILATERSPEEIHRRGEDVDAAAAVTRVQDGVQRGVDSVTSGSRS